MKHAIALLILSLVVPSMVFAHHSIRGEYGGADEEYTYIEGEVVDTRWINPHIAFAVRVTDGYYKPGTVVWANSHPIHIMESEANMGADTVAVGDRVAIYGWQHLRGQPAFHIRALKVNDGPMQSVLAFADMWDIYRGNTDNGITWAVSLEGKSVGRMGEDLVNGLREMGLVSAQGNFTFANQQ